MNLYVSIREQMKPNGSKNIQRAYNRGIRTFLCCITCIYIAHNVFACEPYSHSTISRGEWPNDGNQLTKFKRRFIAYPFFFSPRKFHQIDFDDQIL